MSRSVPVLRHHGHEKKFSVLPCRRHRQRLRILHVILFAL